MSDNICFHKCHEMGKAFCSGCRSLHISTDPKNLPATHPNDTKNPNIKELENAKG